MKKNNIYVTMPTLASLGDVNALLEGVWERGVMTHNGPLVQRFEKLLLLHLLQPLVPLYGRGVPRFL